MEHLLVGLCLERWLHGNGDSTWEPCPGSDMDLRLLGQGQSLCQPLLCFTCG